MSDQIQLPVSSFRCVCKLRWVPKTDREQMVIRNLDAMKCLFRSVIAPDYNAEMAAETLAKKKLDDELEQFLAGIKHTIPFDPGTIGMGDLGGDL
jgi:hypothetical protein